MPDMLVAYFTRKVNAMAARGDQERARIQTPAQMTARNRYVREKSIEMIHGLPERNALDPVVVKSFERDGYKVENIMFQSQPDFWVTGNLYIPLRGSGPYPGIISPCGHSSTARGYPEYQCAYVHFARNGFVVLAYDPIGQGERRYFWNPMTGTDELGGPVTWNHSLPGQLLLLMGEDLTHYFIWDGMRAIDYLLTRPEVDPKRIGCAGHSGGGTLTKFISALDERVQCAAINEGGTANQWPIDIRMYLPMGTGDTEQHLFPGELYGVDNVDLHAAVAPRPLLVTIEHLSPSFNRAAGSIRARYQLLGVPEKFRVVPADDPHAWTVKLRLANVDWFSHWLYNRPGPTVEAPFTPEPWENLWCTVDGSLRYSRQGQTIQSLILTKQATLPPSRTPPRDAPELASYRDQLCREIREVIRYRPCNQPLAPRHVTTVPRKGYQIEKLEFLSEPGIYIPAWVYLPNAGIKDRTALLYVSDTSRVSDGMEFGLLESLALEGRLVIAVDVRGTGDTRPPHSGDEHGEFRQVDNAECTMTYLAWDMNEDLFGTRVLDVVRSIDYTLSRSDVDPAGVHLLGRDTGALWSLYAAALDPRVKSLAAHGGLLSYRALTSVDRYTTESSVFVRDVLTRFDLCHVAAAIAPRPLTIFAPHGPMNQEVELSEAQAAYEWTSKVYANQGAPEHFRVLPNTWETSQAEQYLEVLRTA
jgi:cephalosporin-C deacetylase-like acetyl esterase